MVKHIEVIPIANFCESAALIGGPLEIEPVQSRLEEINQSYSLFYLDSVDVRGEEIAKLALTITAGGNHNILMIGPYGSGETDDRTIASNDDPAKTS